MCNLLYSFYLYLLLLYLDFIIVSVFDYIVLSCRARAAACDQTRYYDLIKSFSSGFSAKKAPLSA